MGNRKLPFGYKMVMGEVVIHPQEAQAVQDIYARYLAGASFNDITDHLKEKGPPYDADKPWNKNMVARILEDNRYAGTERFPATLSAEQLQEAAQRRSERKPTVKITEAQKALRRLCTAGPPWRWNHRWLIHSEQPRSSAGTDQATAADGQPW